PMREPLAYFFTWTTYGTWLPGDERGWVAKPGQFQPPDLHKELTSAGRMSEAAFQLTNEQRQLVERTIADHCRIRGWTLHAVNVRGKQVPAVVTAPGYAPDTVLEQFKSWCTRRLKALDDEGRDRTKWWTQRGSCRWINDQESLEEAIRYTVECQDMER